MENAPRIMVVDDELGICKNVEKILTKSNFKVTHAVSAREAMEKMAKESYSLLISDIVMPEMNGLEFLKLVKKQWPLTKAIMMTAYASTDTAMKAIRLGALDYIPKPFTPDELRSTVNLAIDGKLQEAEVPDAEKEVINIIDVDVPFDQDEVARYTGDDYAESFGRSDMPVVEVKSSQPLEGFCDLGDMVCDIFKKLGATCKAGVKTSACPQKKKKAKKAAGKTDTKTLVGIDQPFNYKEVEAVTGPEYIRDLHHDGVSVPYYESLKENVARLMEKDRIDVDVPFDRHEVAEAIGEDAAEQMTRSDIPVVEISASADLEGFCDMGDMVCDIFKKLGATCKAGVKTSACPQKKKKKRKAKAARAKVDTGKFIAPDMPFDYDQVAAAAGADYVEHLVYDGVVQVPYETLKENVARLTREQEKSSARVQKFPDAPDQRNILVIDDEVAVNNNIRKILEKKGYHVEQAVTREEALDCITSRTYQLILLDLKIPGVSGLELLKAARDHQPDTKVIMITGYASIETAVDAARMGAVDYIPKPFTPDELRTAASNALQLAA